jgi:hypothetical protein
LLASLPGLYADMCVLYVSMYAGHISVCVLDFNVAAAMLVDDRPWREPGTSSFKATHNPTAAYFRGRTT